MTDDQDNQDSYFKEVLDGKQRADEKARQQAIERDQIEQERRRREDQQRRYAVVEMRAIAQDTWKDTKTGADLQAALLDQDVVLAKGENDEIVLIDGGHKMHSLARAAGLGPKAINDRLQDIDINALPDSKQAKTILADRLQNITLPDPAPEISQDKSAPQIRSDKAVEMDKPQPIHAPDIDGPGLGKDRTFRSMPRKGRKVQNEAPPMPEQDRPDDPPQASPPPDQSPPEYSELNPPPPDYDRQEDAPPPAPVNLPANQDRGDVEEPEKTYAEKRNEHWLKLAKDHNTRKDMLEAYGDYRDKRNTPAEEPELTPEEQARRAEIDKETAELSGRLGDKSPQPPADPQPKPSMINRIKTRIMGKSSSPDKPVIMSPDQPKREEAQPEKPKKERKIIDFDNLEPVKDDKKSHDRGDDFTR